MEIPTTSHYASGRFAPLIIMLCLVGAHCQRNASEDRALRNIDLLRGELITCSGVDFGNVRFALSCDPDVRETFNLALSLLHSFEYDEAEKAFVKVIDADPECAMAYWGVAMSLYHALWAPPSEKDLKKGGQLLAIAETLPKTPREQEYLNAIGLYYSGWETTDATTRTQRMADKMEEIYHQHPNDTEAAILYALVLKASSDPTDRTYAHERKAGEILESIFPDQPDHPGIAHYIIHNYDNPALAGKALETARKYAQIAPASAHAQHMPSHIFTRLGLWDESIASNLVSTDAARCYAEGAGFDAHWDEELHGMDYLVYAYLQQGDNQKAEAQLSYLNTMDNFYPDNFKVAYALAAIPARIALENKDWEAAAALKLSRTEFPWEQFPWQKAILHFARGLGAVHMGNIDAAAAEWVILDSLYQSLVARQNAYQANQVLIEAKALEAWLNHAQGDNHQAIALMTQAADMEDNTSKHPVTPCEIIPARELLADLYMALDKPAEALVAYEQDLREHPHRFNGLYGACIAAARTGEMAKAQEYFAQLEVLCASREPCRAELNDARGYLVR